MKTPEEIERLGKREINYQKQLDYFGKAKADNALEFWILGYTFSQTSQCQPQTSEWQLCPKCNGEGRITSNGVATSVFQQCDVCDGAKVLVKSLVNQQDNEEQIKEIIEALTKLKVDSTKPDCKTLRTGDYRIGIDALFHSPYISVQRCLLTNDVFLQLSVSTRCQVFQKAIHHSSLAKPVYVFLLLSFVYLFSEVINEIAALTPDTAFETQPF